MPAPTPLSTATNAFSVSATPMDWAQFWLRVAVSIFVLIMFGFVNYHVMALIEKFATADIEAIKDKLIEPKNRLIDSQVIMALIAGTVTQVVTVLLGITRYLFPSP